MPGFNTVPAVGGGGGQANMTYVASIHMSTYNRSWAQGGTAGYYGLFSVNQENGYAYFVGSGVSTGAPLNRLTNISHAFTRIDIIAPTNDMISLYKAKVKSTTVFNNPFDADPSIGKNAISAFPSTIRSSGNFVLPNNALPLVNVLLVGGGGDAYHHGGGGAGGGVVKLTAYQAVGTTSVTIGAGRSSNGSNVAGGSTFFGNVYALGGQSAVDHSNNPTSLGANGAGASGYAGSLRNGGSGVTQTTSTGLGATGSPVYHGGFSGGGAHGNGGGTHRHQGGGGGGAGGDGPTKPSGTTGGSAGGNGHYSDINGSGLHYGFGGGGADHHGNSSSGDGSWPSHGANGYGHGGRSTYNNHTGGDSGAVIVRYYIA
jgi:hypothetical protein